MNLKLLERYGHDFISAIFSRNEAATQAQVAEIPQRMNRYGNLRPVTDFNPIEVAEDDLVNTFIEDYLEMQGLLKNLKDNSWESLLDYIDYVFKHYKVEKMSDDQTSVTFISLNQLRKVKLLYADMIKPGSALMVAKELVDQIIEEKTKNVDGDTQKLLKAAVYTETGKFSAAGLISIRHLNLSHEKWAKVKELIADALKPVGKKGYISCYQRASRDPKDKWEMITLDFAAL